MRGTWGGKFENMSLKVQNRRKKDRRGGKRESERSKRGDSVLSNQLPKALLSLGPTGAPPGPRAWGSRPSTSGPHTGWFCWGTLSFPKRTLWKARFLFTGFLSLHVVHSNDRHAAAADCIFSLGTPVEQAFAGQAIYMVEGTSHLLIEGHRLEGWVGRGPSRCVLGPARLAEEGRDPSGMLVASSQGRARGQA